MLQGYVAFDASLHDICSLSDADFLKAIRWERGANARLRQTAATGDVDAFRAAWLSRLNSNTGEATPSFGGMTLWSSAAFPEGADLIPLLDDVFSAPAKSRAVHRRPANKSTRSFAQRAETLVYALTAKTPESGSEAAAFALATSLELLAFAGARLRPEQFWRLWRHALLQTIQLTGEAAHSDPTVPPDIELMEQGEIPFCAGALFEGVAGTSPLVKSGRKKLARELVARTDTDGTPHAELVERLPLWLAPLIRATQIARLSNVRLWARNHEELLRSLVERSIPLCRPDGRAALSNGLHLEPLPVLNAAAQLCGLPPLGDIGTYLQSIKRIASGKSPRRARNDGVKLMPSNQSDFARFALLRSDWTVKADSVALTHHRHFPQLDVTAAGRPLFHGDWSLHLTIGDVPVELAKEWQCVCWQSDPDADFIELQMVGPGKLRVERIAMLSRTQRFLLLADSISGVPHERIEYMSQLPIRDDVHPRIDPPTREIQLAMKGFRSRVFPLAVAQDRVLSTPHEFTVTDGRLTLKQSSVGEGIFAPLVFDWNPSRSRAEAVWRTLTVTEEGQVVDPGVACGHRLHVADLRLLVYRSLKSTGNSRAVLGHHTFNETVVAQIQKNGDVDPILMVE